MIGEQATSSLQGKMARPSPAALGGERMPSPRKGPEEAGTAAEPAATNGSAGAKPVPLSMRLTGELVSILAMAMATMAIGVALHLHLGFDVWVAATCAVGCYAAMLLVHALMPRHFLVEKVLPATGTITRATALQSENGDASQAIRPLNSPPTQGPLRTSAGQANANRPPMPPRGARVATQTTQTAGPGNGDDGFSLAPPLPPRMPYPPPLAPTEKKASPHHTAPHSSALPAPVKTPPPSAGLAPSPRESDVEMIQSLIRKLADEVNSATSSPPRDANEVATVSERAISTSLDALKATAGSMRAQDEAAQRRQSAPPCEAPAERATESGRPPEVNARLSALAEALALNRVEVLLDPIVDFNAGAPRHFELYLRLRDERGRILDTEESREDFAGTGMLPRIDGSRIAHASQVAVRFAGRGRKSALFSTVSGEALSANKFLQGVADAYRERRSVAGVLIMTFSQADIRGFGAREWHALAEFAAIGFRYCICEVMDLDMDFEDIKSRGFDFAKLDASVFLEGLPAGNELFIPAQDICQHLAGQGLSLIVGDMQNQETAAKVFGFGVLFGQGTLFGGAKAVKRDLFSKSATAAA